MTALILVRHGYSMANAKGIFAGHFDAELSEKGYKQAELTAKYIAANFKPDIIYSSDLKRAYSTAEAIAAECGIEIIKECNLREIRAGKWDGMRFDDITKNYKEEYRVWLEDIGNAVCTGGESTKELAGRVYKAVERIAAENDGKTVVITTHATPIRSLECMIKNNMSLAEMKNIPWVSNASVTVVKAEKGKLSLEIVGEDSYLLELKTELPKNV